jgi:HlyD family secretion protein
VWVKLMAGRFKYLFTLAVPLAIAAAGTSWALGWTVGGWGFGRSADGSTAYDTSEITRGEIRRLVSTSGPVRAVVTVSIGSQLSGRIDLLKVDFNSEVKEGDLLAQIDDKTFAAKVAQARADLVAGKAGLLNQQAARAKAEAMLRNAKRLLERQETLANKGVASTATLDTAIRDVDVAVAEIAVIDAQIENAKATISQREAALRVAEIDLERTSILSPIDGTVISRTIDIGQTVAASLQAPELFKIAQDLRRIQIEAQVNEADVGVIKEGNPAEFVVDAYPEERFEGVVTQVRLAAIELQNVVTYTVIIEARNDDRRLFPGMTANVQIETAKRAGIMRVANDALRFKPRDQSAAQEMRDPAKAAARSQRVVEQLKTSLKLSEEQTATLVAAMQQFAAERAASRQQGGAQPAGEPQGGGAEGGDRSQRNGFMERLEAAIEPTLTAEQKPLLDRWRKDRKSTRMGTVWMLNAQQQLERRQVRLGISDDQYVELLGGGFKPGDRVVTRARQTTTKR